MRMRTNGRRRPLTPQDAQRKRQPVPGPRGRRSTFTPHLVEGVVDAAVGAVVTGDAPALADALGLLTVGPDTPDGAALVDQVIGRRLLAALGDAWGNGWQPADLVRVMARELGRPHVNLASRAVVREAALYPPAAVPSRWRDQVDEIAGDLRTRGRGQGADGPAGAGGPGGRASDPRWAVTGRGDGRPGSVQVAVETLAHLTRLPPVPKLAAAPGEAHGDGDGPDVDPRMLHRVRSLLAKAESTGFPDEAEALTAKAQELMARYAIDAAVVAVERGRAADVTGRRLAVEDPYAPAKAMLLEAIASANRCRSVWTKAFGYATVFGDESDLDAVELLYTSLLVQAARALFAEGSGPDRPGAGRTRSYRQSFLVAFAMRIGDRLKEAVEAATEAATGGGSVSRESLLPVLANRREAATAACDAAFPHIKATRLTANDRAGWSAGQQAAEAAQLDRHTQVASRSPKVLG